MKSRFPTIVLSVVGLLIVFNLGYILGQSPIAPYNVFTGRGLLSDGRREAAEPFWEVWDLVHARYYEQPINDEELVTGAINGMLGALGDQHTRYLEPQEETAAQEEMEGEFQGIGVVVEELDGNIVVVSPIEGSPAEAAGLLPGDILLRADGIDLQGKDTGAAADIIRGPAGTSVELVIERDGEQLTYTIVRDVIKVSSVRGEMLEDNIAYVRISQFIRTTNEDLEKTLEELLAQNPDGLILDLRRNPGGLLDQVNDVADQFLPEGVVLVEEIGSSGRKVYESTDRGAAEEIPMVVLIDEGSASASEVLAGAIQDRDRGILVGGTSFGKGTVQLMYPLSNGGGLRLTIARWLTPDENWVHEKGLTPDLAVTLPAEEEGAATGDPAEFEDAQLKTAIDYLLGKSALTVGGGS